MLAIKNCSQQFCSKVSEKISALPGYAQRIPGASKVGQLYQAVQKPIFPIFNMNKRTFILVTSALTFNVAIGLSKQSQYIPYAIALTSGAIGYVLGKHNPDQTEAEAPTEEESDDVLRRADDGYTAQEYSSALTDYNEVLQANPYNYNALLGRARTSLQLSELETVRADGIVLAGLSQKIFRSEGNRLLGWVNYEEGDKAKAYRYFSNAQKINPNNFRAVYAKSIASFDLRNYDQALLDSSDMIHLGQQTLSKQCSEKIANSIKPKIGMAWINKGDVFLYRGNLEEALYCYQEGLKVDPEDESALFSSAYASALLGKKEEFTDIVPTDVLRGWISADTAQHKKTDIAEAEILERGDNFLSIVYYENLGFSLLREKKYDEALAAFKSALEIDDEDLHIFSGIALAYQGLSQEKEALEYAEKVIEDFQIVDDLFENEAAANAFDVLAALSQDPEKAATAREHAQSLRKGDYQEKLISSDEHQEWLALFQTEEELGQ